MPSDQQLKHRDNYQTKHKQAHTVRHNWHWHWLWQQQQQKWLSPSTLYSRPQLIASGVTTKWWRYWSGQQENCRITRKNSARLSSIYIDKSVITINTCVPLWRCALSLSACARFAPSFSNNGHTHSLIWLIANPPGYQWISPTTIAGVVVLLCSLKKEQQQIIQKSCISDFCFVLLPVESRNNKLIHFYISKKQ